ncbi:DUF4864 domain-containing protein [Pleurocapsa sp. PCC 7319]|uniref:DUF4864 domain-containing protein n=1 Tax=Pleurocapsa sp. PCC 7319 TaxID=118161 RepID=UPI00034B8D8B|nr:DUF4864 domain-containing protein [Pleurocapsa sp. PCC 7319]
MYITEHDKAIIRQLVEKQLQAFQQNDGETAFALTSPTVQSKFEQTEDFIMMLKDKYHCIFSSRSIMFRGFTLISNYPALVSVVMDQGGNLAQGVFILQHQPDYSWRIHGYELLSIDEKII